MWLYHYDTNPEVDLVSLVSMVPHIWTELNWTSIQWIARSGKTDGSSYEMCDQHFCCLLFALIIVISEWRLSLHSYNILKIEYHLEEYTNYLSRDLKPNYIWSIYTFDTSIQANTDHRLDPLNLPFVLCCRISCARFVNVYATNIWKTEHLDTHIHADWDMCECLCLPVFMDLPGPG